MNGKIKYIFKKLLTIFLIAFLSIFLYEFFMEIKKVSNQEETYGTKLSAEEESKEPEEDLSSIIEKASNCVVGISKIKNIHSAAFLPQNSDTLGLGSGVIISKKGYIITNQHVVGDSPKNCYVTIQEGKTYRGNVVWSNSEIDLAIIKVEEYFSHVATIGNSDAVRVGESVYAIGNPIRV